MLETCGRCDTLLEHNHFLKNRVAVRFAASGHNSTIANNEFMEDKDAAIWAELAEMYAYLGDLPKYSSAMEKAMALDPDNPQVLLSSADVHEALGERRLAIELANKAVANGLRLAILDTDPEARKFRADPDFRPPGR